MSKVNKGVEIIIATPGRLNDLCAASMFFFINFHYVV